MIYLFILFIVRPWTPLLPGTDFCLFCSLVMQSSYNSAWHIAVTQYTFVARLNTIINNNASVISHVN